MLNRRILFFFCIGSSFIGFSWVYPVFASPGISFDNKYMHPGKADFHYLHTKTTDEYNLIWWSPGFKGGAGLIESDTSNPTNYSGGYFRPLLPKDDNGELIFGYLQVDTASTYSHEFQGEST